MVRVKAASLNHLDLWVRAGNPAYKISLPHILGNDISGELASFGPSTSSTFAIGDRVIVSPGISCWNCPNCRSGRDNLCESYRIIGADGGWGGHAQWAVVPERNLLPVPKKDMTFEEAASYPLTFLTAYHMLKSLAKIKPGETLLVLGSGSGVGAAAVQIGRALQARVVAASSSSEKLERAGELGAQHLLLTEKGKLDKDARRILGRCGADVVFEHIGGEMFSSALRLLAPGGRIVTCGATADPLAKLDLRYIFFKELSVLGAKMGTLAELKEVGGLFSDGTVAPVIDRTFPLSEAAQAHAYLSGRNQFGKVVLVP